METHVVDICFGIMFYKSFQFPAALTYSRCIVCHQSRLRTSLWCPPYHFWHHICYDLSDWRDVTFFQISQCFASWQQCDKQSWVIFLRETRVKRSYIPHRTLPCFWKALGQRPRKTTSELIRCLAGCLVHNTKAQGSDSLTSKLSNISFGNTHRALAVWIHCV